MNSEQQQKSLEISRMLRKNLLNFPFRSLTKGLFPTKKEVYDEKDDDVPLNILLKKSDK